MSRISKKKRFLISAVVLFVLTILAIVMILPANAATWNLSGSILTHDPSMIKEGNTWWEFNTANGIGVKYSSDGLTWRDSPAIFTSNLSWWSQYVPAKTDRNVWAPDVFYYKGRYWVYYSVSTFGSNTSCIGLTSCSSIAAGDWRDDGVVINSTSSNSYNCIDANVALDQSGNLWMSFGSYWDGIQIVQLDPSTMKPLNGSRPANIAKRSGGIEAPYIIYNNGYYYLFVSFDKCCSGVSSTYKIAYGRSTSITGPYVDKNGVNMLSGGGTVIDQSEGQWIGPGGQSVVQNGSNYIMVNHAYNAYANGAATLRIKDLYFDSTGWPTYTYNDNTTTNTAIVNTSSVTETPAAEATPTRTRRGR